MQLNRKKSKQNFLTFSKEIQGNTIQHIKESINQKRQFFPNIFHIYKKYEINI